MKSFLKKILKILLILFLAFIALCIYAYYQMKAHIDAFMQIQKEVNEANATSLLKSYGTDDKNKIFNRLIMEYLENLEKGEENASL